MFRGRRMMGQAWATIVAMGIVAKWVALARADSTVPVARWVHYLNVSTHDTANIHTATSSAYDSTSSSPWFGNGTPGSANNYPAWGTTVDQNGDPTNVVIQPGEETTLSGTLRIERAGVTAATNIPNTDVRLAIWNKVNPNAPEATGWLGYMAFIGSGNNAGDLEVINPDDPSFNTGRVGDLGGGSIASTLGPAPICSAGTTCDPDPLSTNGVNVMYRGTGRYIRLAQAKPVNNVGFHYNTDYSFSFRVARLGTSDYDVTATVTQISLLGDYNNDDTVNAADYTVWRNSLGSTTPLPNRDPANSGPISQADYVTWQSQLGQQKYSWVNGGIDFDGVKPLNSVDGTYTQHTTNTFNRAEIMFGGSTHTDTGILGNVQFGTDQIQTLSLELNTTTGAANILNALATPLSIDHYEISSAKGALVQANWTGIDGTAMSAPDGSGWDVDGGTSNNFLAETNLSGPLTLNPGDATISLGNIFNPATTLTNRDLRFFIHLSGGQLIRGNVLYGAAPGTGAAVPEPSAWVLLVAGAAVIIGGSRRARQ